MPSSQDLSRPVSTRISIDNQIDPASNRKALVELRQGLSENPRRIPTRFLYDRKGSELFEKITNLVEYYLTRAERSLLEQHANKIQSTTSCEELVELGAGAATKTRLLLDAMQSAGKLDLYIPLDVSESEVRRVAEELVEEYPGLKVHGIVADFVHHLTAIPSGVNRLILLLGSTIGNFSHDEAVDFLKRISSEMEECDYFLIGVDLIKDVAIIEAAYNDESGITADFNRNILRVVNQFAQADFQPEQFDHRAFYNSDLSRIEMHLVASRQMSVTLEALDLRLEIGAGEALFTEISCKYDRAMTERMLREAQFQVSEWFTDPAGLFALALARKSC